MKFFMTMIILNEMTYPLKEKNSHFIYFNNGSYKPFTSALVQTSFFVVSPNGAMQSEVSGQPAQRYGFFREKFQPLLHTSL